MILRLRHLPSYSATSVVALLLIIFIVVPVGMVLFESIKLAGPIPIHDLAAMTKSALEKIDPAERDAQVGRWVRSLKPDEKTSATGATLELIGLNAHWDRQASFDEQAKAAADAVAALSPEDRKKFDETFALGAMTLHKRIPLAFRIRDKLTPAEFDLLREGVRDGYGLDNYVAVFTSPRLHRAFRNSLVLSAIVAMLTTAAGFAIAYGVNRGAIANPRLVRYMTLIPLVSPPVIISTSLILLFGRNGTITKGFFQDILGWIDADQTNLYGWAGVIVAQVLGHVPASFIILDNVLSKQDGRIEEAAASQGAGAWRIFTHVTLPMSQPGIVRSLVLIFMVIMTDFGNPLVIGRDIPVLAGILYDEMTGFQNTRLAGALAVWMILPALLVYYGIERIGRRKRYSSAVATPPELPVPKVAKTGLTTLAWAVIGFTLLLYGTIVAASFVKVWRVDYGFTLAWYTTGALKGLGAEARGIGVVVDSLRVAVLAAPVGGLFAIILAYLVERARPPGANAIGFMALLPAILPGVIIGVGYVVAFNLPLGIKSLSLTSTMWIIVINILFANIYIGYLAGRAVLQRYDASIDEAAESLGASLWQRFAWVTLPIMRHALMLGTLYIFVHGLTTLSAVIFLVSPANKLAAVTIFGAAEAGHYGSASAISVAILVIVFAALGLMHYMEKYGPVWARVGAVATGRT